MTANHPSPIQGQGIVEYALILVLIAIVVIGVLTLVGTQTSGIFSMISSALSGSRGGGGEEPPPECYGTLLLPLMLGMTGVVSGLKAMLGRPRRLTPA